MEKLQNSIRDYAWGSRTVLADLLGHAPSGGPEAEVWVGAHHAAPSRLISDGRYLTDVLRSHPHETLGERFAQPWDGQEPTLPFLLKVLAADAPLSLQVHPNAQQAQDGFAKEHAAGVSFNAIHRMYRDPRPKPEMVVALTDFHALTGFRSDGDALPAVRWLVENAVTDRAVSVAQALADAVAQEDVESATRMILGPSAGVRQLVEESAAAVKADTATASSIDPMLDLVPYLATRYPGDPGALLTLLLNYVHLRPGEAMALPAGNLHAYLSGTAVEVMGNSDNILRCGLTPKYVNVDELISVVRFAALDPHWIQPERLSPGVELFHSGFHEFDLMRFRGTAHEKLPLLGPACIIALEGTVTLRGEDGTSVTLTRGESAFIPVSAGTLNVDADEQAHAYLAAAPSPQ